MPSLAPTAQSRPPSEPDEQEALAHAYFILDWALVELGRGSEAVHSQRALELYQELGKLGPPATIYNNLGLFAWWEGRWDEAVELYDKGRQLRRSDRRRGRRGDRHAQHRRGAERPGPAGRGAAAVRGVAARVARRRLPAPASPTRPAASVAWPAAAATSSARTSCTTAAREQFQAVLAESELIDTDARIAEALVLQGRCEDAIELTSACLNGRRQAAAQPRTPCCTGCAATPTPSGVTVIVPRRISRRACARRVSAMLAMRSRSRWMRSRGQPNVAETAISRHAGKLIELFASLGVVFVPTVPLERDQSAVA